MTIEWLFLGIRWSFYIRMTSKWRNDAGMTGMKTLSSWPHSFRMTQEWPIFLILTSFRHSGMRMNGMMLTTFHIGKCYEFALIWSLCWTRKALFEWNFFRTSGNWLFVFAPNLPLFLQQIENKPQSWNPTTAEQALINLDFMRFCEDISESKIHEQVMRVNVLVVKTGK